MDDMKNWRLLKENQEIHFTGSEFDGKWDCPCVVVQICDEYALAEYEGVILTIDDDTAELFV